MVYFGKSAKCVSQTVRPNKLYYKLYFVFEWPVPAYIFAHWSNMACLPSTRINTHRHLVEAENAISNWEFTRDILYCWKMFAFNSFVKKKAPSCHHLKTDWQWNVPSPVQKNNCWKWHQPNVYKKYAMN